MEPILNTSAVQVEKTRIIALERGKLPPQAIDIEEAVLGAMLIDSKSVDECLMVLKSSDIFYKEAHIYIFEAIEGLHADNHGIDIMTVSARLRAQGLLERAGGDFYLIELTQKISSGAHIEWHSRILIQQYIKREVIMQASRLMATAYDDDKDSLELLEEWGSALDAMSERSLTGKKTMTYAEALDAVEARVLFLTNKAPEDLTGARTGFEVTDKFTGGYQPGELIVIAARPGMGKTAKVLKTAVENAKRGAGVGFISAEMSIYSLAARTVAIDTDFHLSQITKHGFEKNEYFSTLGKHKFRMRNYPIYIDDAGSPDIRDVISKARTMKRKYDIKIFIVDYLQLISDKTKGNNREQEVSAISRKLKGLAKELDIPVIMLSQLSRKVEERGSSKRPLLSDLRESGAIEQDADIVEFLYRAEYYKLEVEEDILDAGGNAEVIYAKYRQGAPDTIPLYWQGDKTKFMDPDEHRREVEQRNEEAQRNATRPLPTPSPNDAFGKPYSIQDNSTNDNSVPF